MDKKSSDEDRSGRGKPKEEEQETDAEDTASFEQHGTLHQECGSKKHKKKKHLRKKTHHHHHNKSVPKDNNEDSAVPSIQREDSALSQAPVDINEDSSTILSSSTVEEDNGKKNHSRKKSHHHHHSSSSSSSSKSVPRVDDDKTVPSLEQDEDSILPQASLCVNESSSSILSSSVIREDDGENKHSRKKRRHHRHHRSKSHPKDYHDVTTVPSIQQDEDSTLLPLALLDGNGTLSSILSSSTIREDDGKKNRSRKKGHHRHHHRSKSLPKDYPDDTTMPSIQQDEDATLAPASLGGNGNSPSILFSSMIQEDDGKNKGSRKKRHHRHHHRSKSLPEDYHDDTVMPSIQQDKDSTAPPASLYGNGNSLSTLSSSTICEDDGKNKRSRKKRRHHDHYRHGSSKSVPVDNDDNNEEKAQSMHEKKEGDDGFAIESFPPDSEFVEGAFGQSDRQVHQRKTSIASTRTVKTTDLKEPLERKVSERRVNLNGINDESGQHERKRPPATFPSSVATSLAGPSLTTPLRKEGDSQKEKINAKREEGERELFLRLPSRVKKRSSNHLKEAPSTLPGKSNVGRRCTKNLLLTPSSWVNQYPAKAPTTQQVSERRTSYTIQHDGNSVLPWSGHNTASHGVHGNESVCSINSDTAHEQAINREVVHLANRVSLEQADQTTSAVSPSNDEESGRPSTERDVHATSPTSRSVREDTTIEDIETGTRTSSSPLYDNATVSVEVVRSAVVVLRQLLDQVVSATNVRPVPAAGGTNKKGRTWFVLVTIVVITAAAIVILSSTPAPTSMRFGQVVRTVQSISNSTSMLDPSSPQHQAARWIADVDGIFEDLTTVDPERFRQRYATLPLVDQLVGSKRPSFLNQTFTSVTGSTRHQKVQLQYTVLLVSIIVHLSSG